MPRARPLLWLLEGALRLHARVWNDDDVGRAGEDAAFFHLRRDGFVVVAQDWHDEYIPGDIDLVAWEGETLCFVEVKTRSARGAFAAELAVDHDKQAQLHRMADAYLRALPWRGGVQQPIRTRFDVVSVYLDGDQPDVRLLRDAFQ